MLCTLSFGLRGHVVTSWREVTRGEGLGHRVRQSSRGCTARRCTASSDRSGLAPKPHARQHKLGVSCRRNARALVLAPACASCEEVCVRVCTAARDTSNSTVRTFQAAAMRALSCGGAATRSSPSASTPGPYGAAWYCPPLSAYARSAICLRAIRYPSTRAPLSAYARVL